jgi:hypothetical protein
MSLMDQIEVTLSNPDARAEIGPMLERMGCRVGLFFAEGIEETNRRILRLTGGVTAFGNMELSVPVHGKDRRPSPPSEQVARHESVGISITKVNRAERI